MEFKWVLIIIGVIAFLIIFSKGSSKGGVVVNRVKADLNILSPQFAKCRPEASYTTFKEGKPHKIDIEVENLPLQPGEVLDVYINRKLLSRIEVERDREAEFEHWSNEGVEFPQIQAGDKIDFVYQNQAVISGVFA